MQWDSTQSKVLQKHKKKALTRIPLVQPFIVYQATYPLLVSYTHAGSSFKKWSREEFSTRQNTKDAKGLFRKTK